MNEDQENLDHLHSTTPFPLHLHPSVLVAVATLVLAGSAVFWKSNLRFGNLRLLPKGLEHNQQSQGDEHEPHDVSEGNNLNDASKAQASRSKERRKRRKDPMKELMKGGKKAKDLAKLLKHVDFPGPSDPSSSSVPNSALHSAFVPAQPTQEPSLDSIRLKRSRSLSRSESGTRDLSVSFSSRSVSISSAAGASARSGPPGDDGEEQDQEEEIPLTAMPPSPALPAEINSGHSPSTSYDSTPSLAVSMFSIDSVDTADTSFQSAKYLDIDPSLDEERSKSIPSSATPLPKSTSKNIRRNKNSNIKNSTLDNFLTNKLNSPDSTDVSPVMLAPSQSMPSNVPYTQSQDSIGSSLSTLNVNTTSTSSPASSRAAKPPRFRSQTRQEPSTGQGTSPSGTGLGFSTSMPIYSTFHVGSSSSNLESHFTDGKHVKNEDLSASHNPLSFPTLNGISGSGSASGNEFSSKTSSSAGVGTPPSGSTNSTSLSTQTQIASLRGALEASRKREEEAKGNEERTRCELERIENELKVLRWEGHAWRRREGELQAQLHHLVHQIHSYAAYYAPPPQQFPLQSQDTSNPQPQRASGKHSKGKRQNQTSPTSSRSTSKSSRPSRSSHASPIPPLAQLPEGQAMSQGSSSPSVGSPVVPPNRMFTPSLTFSPGPSSTPFLPNLHNIGPFSPSSSFGMFSPTGIPSGGMPFASPQLGSASMMSPLSPQSPYLPYPPYTAFGGFSQGQNQTNGNGNGGRMHPMQFLNMLNNSGKENSASAGPGTEPGGTMSTSSSMSSLPSDSNESMSPELNMSPSPAPGPSRERGRKRGRGGVASTGNSDRIIGGYGPEYQYGYTYGYPYPYPMPHSYHAYPGSASISGENAKEVEGLTENKNSYDADSEHGIDGEVNELLAGSILKRPESMMGLRRSGSGGSSKSKSAQEKLRMSPMNVAGLGDELRDGQQLAEDGLSVASPSSDSGVGLMQGLDWLHDPALFRRDSSDAFSSQRSPPTMDAMPVSMPSSPPQSKLHFASNSTSTEIDLDVEFSSSESSSSTKSTSENTSSTESSDSVAETSPVEFTFPSIATWGYSYQTHSAGDLEDHDKTLNVNRDVKAKDGVMVHDTDTDEEITPPVAKLHPMGTDSNPISSDTTITTATSLNDDHDAGRIPPADEITA